MRVVVMGVTGCGKSTVGRWLADDLGYPFADADDFHPPGNVAKMAESVPLTDEDRMPWLDVVGAWLSQRDDAVIACSALSRVYRDAIRRRAPDAVFVHLYAPKDVIAARVRRRSATTSHFAGAGLLDAQYRDLVPLGPDEVGASIDVTFTQPKMSVLIARAALDAAS